MKKSSSSVNQCDVKSDAWGGGYGVKDWFMMGGEDKPLSFCRITFPVCRAQSCVLVGTGECSEVRAFF